MSVDDEFKDVPYTLELSRELCLERRTDGELHRMTRQDPLRKILEYFSEGWKRYYSTRDYLVRQEFMHRRVSYYTRKKDL